MEKCCGERGEVLWGSVVEKCCEGGVVEKCCEGVVERAVEK